MVNYTELSSGLRRGQKRDEEVGGGVGEMREEKEGRGSEEEEACRGKEKEGRGERGGEKEEGIGERLDRERVKEKEGSEEKGGREEILKRGRRG